MLSAVRQLLPLTLTLTLTLILTLPLTLTLTLTLTLPLPLPLPLNQVRQLLDTLLARARRVDVLGFRYACYASAPLLEVRLRVEVRV